MANQTLFGWHAVQAMLARHPERVRELHLQQGREDKRQQAVLALAEQFGVAVAFSRRKALDEFAGSGAHQGVVAVVKPMPPWSDAELLQWLERTPRTPLLLVLDGVTDPHNLGACLRSADAAGVDAVIVPKDKSASLTPAAVKVASGAAQTVPLARVTNLARTMRELQQAGVWLVGTAGETSQRLWDADLKGPLALVMGAEGKGMRRLTREHCDQLVQLPMAGTVDSLNVSVAAGVCLFEAVRQRQS